MTKRHFNDLANRLYILRPKYDEKTSTFADLMRLDQWKKMVQEMADFCATHGANFNRERFLTACGE